jgi:hypothetical protein
MEERKSKGTRVEGKGLKEKGTREGTKEKRRIKGMQKIVILRKLKS